MCVGGRERMAARWNNKSCTMHVVVPVLQSRKCRFFLSLLEDVKLIRGFDILSFLFDRLKSKR